MSQQEVSFDYYYGYESEQFAFYRIPKVLFTNDYFKGLSSDAKILYGLMLDRISLSVKNHWIDNEDRVYIIFTLEQVMEYMNCGKDKGVKILAELDTEKGIGLIERVKRGLGKPTLIYVKNFTFKEKPVQRSGREEQVEEGIIVRSPDSGKTELHTSKKPKSAGANSRSQDFWKSEVRTSEKTESGVLENRSLEVGISDSNNTDFNNTNRINPSNQYTDMGFDMVQVYTDMVKTNIEFDSFVSGGGKEKQLVDEIVDLMVDTICAGRDSISIAGAEYPYQFVKERLLKVNYSHIHYVLDCLHCNSTKIKNIKAYLLTCIFNAPVTMHNYYQAEVNHDILYRN